MIIGAIVTDDRARIVAFLRRADESLVGRVEPFRFGTALLTDPLPKVWDVNYLRVERPATAAELDAEAEAIHSALGHGHRKLLVEDAELAATLRPELEALGWEAAENVLMVLRRPPDRRADTSPVREVSPDELRPAQRRGMETEPWASGDDDAVEQVLAAQYLEGAFHVRRLAALVDGEIASYCDLYEDGPIAQVEALMTLEAYRGRGLARAVMSKAVDEALAGGAELVFLVALAEDWPKELWAKLGFDVVGSVWWFQITRDGRLERELRRLLEETGATRVTLRSERPDDFYPVTHETLSPGAISIRDGAGVDLRGQPVARLLEETGEQVVQHDCATAFDDPAFQLMLEAYGGLASQIVTPILEGGRLVAILSLHQCGEPRTWTDDEIALAAGTADRVKEILNA